MTRFFLKSLEYAYRGSPFIPEEKNGVPYIQKSLDMNKTATQKMTHTAPF